MIEAEENLLPYLEARATGSGDVRYVGDPVVRHETSGSGDVERLSE